MNAAIAVVGFLFMVAFAVTWHPGGWLLAGVALLLFANLRRLNQKGGERR